MSKPMTLDELLGKLHESIAGLGQALVAGLVPAIGSINTVAMQLAIEYESALQAALHKFEWDEIEFTLKNPHRWQFESLVDWGNRLERAGLLDKYEYRLMYGAECWRAVLHSPVWYATEVWDWLRYEAWEVVRGLWTKS